MKTGIIIQARMGSTRMPGKVLTPFYGASSILDLVIQTAKKNKFSFPVIVATSLSKEDDAIENLATKNGLAVFRGDEKNVLKRFVDAAHKFTFDHVVRVCADNPLLDLGLFNELLVVAEKDDSDYVSYKVDEHTPAIRSHWGIFAEVVKTDALDRALVETNDPIYLEHVTNYIYMHPEKFSLNWVKAPEEIYGINDIRFTVDTSEDFRMMQEFYALLAERANPVNFKGALSLLELHPEFKKIMQERISANAK